MRDFVEITQGTLLKYLRSLAEQFIGHVKGCVVCKDKGFICEYCKSKETIYPFQLKTVKQCKACKSFFHKNCYSMEKCPKCSRIVAKLQS